MILKQNQKPSYNPICPDCNTPGGWKEHQIGDMVVYTPCFNCTCEKKREAREEAEKQRKQEQTKIENAIKNSCIYPYYEELSLEKLDKIKNLDFCKKFVQEFDPQKSEGLQLVGEKKTGKSSLLAAMCNDLIKKGYTCLFITFTELLEKFAAHNEEHYANVYELLEWLTTFNFVVLDDVGRHPVSKFKANFAHMIVNRLKHKKITTAISANRKLLNILTSNEEMEDTLSILGEMCTIKLDFNGKSLSKKS